MNEQRISDEQLALQIKCGKLASMQECDALLDLRDARQRIASLQADNDRLRAACEAAMVGGECDCNAIYHAEFESGKRCAFCVCGSALGIGSRNPPAPPKSPEGVTENGPTETDKLRAALEWVKANLETVDDVIDQALYPATCPAPAPVWLTREEQVEAVRLLDRIRMLPVTGYYDVVKLDHAMVAFLSRPAVAALLKERE